MEERLSQHVLENQGAVIGTQKNSRGQTLLLLCLHLLLAASVTLVTLYYLERRGTGARWSSQFYQEKSGRSGIPTMREALAPR